MHGSVSASVCLSLFYAGYLVHAKAENVCRQMKILLSKATMAAPESEKYTRIRDRFAERMRAIGAGVNKAADLYSQLAAVSTHKVGAARIQTLKASKVPVQVMRGDQDNLVRTSNSDKIAKRLGVECVVIPDCGHGMLDEQPDRVVEEMVSFLTSVTQRPSTAPPTTPSSAQ